jgi:hypothetical protein
MGVEWFLLLFPQHFNGFRMTSDIFSGNKITSIFL